MNDFMAEIAPVVWPEGNRTGELLHSSLNALHDVQY